MVAALWTNPTHTKKQMQQPLNYGYTNNGSLHKLTTSVVYNRNMSAVTADLRDTDLELVCRQEVQTSLAPCLFHLSNISFLTRSL